MQIPLLDPLAAKTVSVNQIFSSALILVCQFYKSQQRTQGCFFNLESRYLSLNIVIVMDPSIMLF